MYYAAFDSLLMFSGHAVVLVVENPLFVSLIPFMYYSAFQTVTIKLTSLALPYPVTQTQSRRYVVGLPDDDKLVSNILPHC